ncbi:MAG: class I SAM-dependent methyltransferase [Actinomycetota bacterium]|nr:class I SAM-dependent methyltransferase [Actinomycetota bacterium]
MTRAETDRVRRIWDRCAPRFDKRIGFFERVLFEGGREWVCSRARGKTLEIAVGTGRNLALYAGDVELTGIELSEAMLAIARRRAEDLGRDVDLRPGDAQALEFPDETFDTVTCTISLCSIPDDRAAVREARRVLRAGGRFVLMEHVRSPILAVRAVQRAIDPLTVRFEGDHVTREPLDHLRAEGFEIETLERLKWGIVERVVALRGLPGRWLPGPGRRRITWR